ncbi:MAG: TonB-dependent receptor plug domain-containing protein, partial [Candidatus Kapaibacteriota bacterium]
MPLSLYNLFKYKISKIALILIILFSLNLTLPLLVISKSIKVIENETNLPVKNATVKLFVINDEINLSKNPILIKTNENGDFEIEKKYEKYPIHCTVSCVGFYRTNDTITATTKTIKLIKKIIYSEEVVTTGQFIPTTAQESPFSVKVITQERIEAQGAVNLRDIMTNELNVRIGQDNVLGSSMSIRGVSGQNVKILVDGVPVIGRVGGNIDISQMN